LREKFDTSRSNELLWRPASSEPLSIPQLGVSVVLASRNQDIYEEIIAFDGILVPPKHRVDTFGKLGRICLVNTTGVYPAVAQPVILGLDCAETELVIASLATSSAVYDVFVTSIPVWRDARRNETLHILLNTTN
jgi:hypothetical protein